MWRKARVEPLLKDIFHSRKWYIAKTIANGDCSLDSLAVAFRLPRIQDVFDRIRQFVAQTNPDIDFEDVREKKAKAHQWLSIDDINFICMKQFKTIPIILDMREKEDEIPFAFDAPTNATFAKLRDELITSSISIGRELQYLIMSYDGSHFEPYGAKCKEVVGHSRPEAEAYRTLFAESQLPSGLLEAWNEAYAKFLRLKIKSAKQQRQARKPGQKKKDADIVEISD